MSTRRDSSPGGRPARSPYLTPIHRRERGRYDAKRVGLLTWREFDVLDLAALLAPQPLTATIVAERICRSRRVDTGNQVLRRMGSDGVGLLTSHPTNPGARPAEGGNERHWLPTPLARALYREALDLIDDHNEARTA